MSTAECSEKRPLEQFELEQYSYEATLKEREPTSAGLQSRRKLRLFICLQVLLCVLLWTFVSSVLHGGIRLALDLHRTTIQPSTTLLDNEALFIDGVNGNPLCSKLQIANDNDRKKASLSSQVVLYSLRHPPSLDGYNNVTASSNRSVEPLEAFTFWNGYLYRGSEVQLSACTVDEQSVDIMFFSSEDNYLAWQNRPESYEAAFNVSTVSTLCPNVHNVTVVTPDAVSNRWYIAVRNTQSRNSAIVYISADIQKKVYTIADDNVLSSCKASHNQNCELPILAHSGATYVAANVLPSGYEGSKSSEIEVKCIADGWVYAAVLVPSIVIILVVGILCVLGYCYFRQRACRECAAMKCRSRWSPCIIGQKGIVEDGKICATTSTGGKGCATTMSNSPYVCSFK